MQRQTATINSTQTGVNNHVLLNTADCNYESTKTTIICCTLNSESRD